MSLLSVGKGALVVVARAPMVDGQSADAAGFVASVGDKQAKGATKAQALAALEALLTSTAEVSVAEVVNAIEDATEPLEPKQRAKKRE